MLLQYPRGAVYWMEGPFNTTGSEQKGTRPVLIVSNNKNNTHSSTVNVIPITSSSKTTLPTHITIPGITNTEVINILLCEQITCVSKSRLKNFCGILTPDIMRQVESALAIQLGIVPLKNFNPQNKPETETNTPQQNATKKITDARGYTEEYKKEYLRDAEKMSNSELAAKYHINAKAASARRISWQKQLNKN